MIPTHLKVLTIVERPFIYIRNKTFGVTCQETSPKNEWIECPEYVFQSVPGHDRGSYCCRGYCIDLLKRLSVSSNFTYSLYVSLAGDYGNLERNNQTGKQEWTGLIGELVQVALCQLFFKDIIRIISVIFSPLFPFCIHVHLILFDINNLQN